MWLTKSKTFTVWSVTEYVTPDVGNYTKCKWFKSQLPGIDCKMRFKKQKHDYV